MSDIPAEETTGILIGESGATYIVGEPIGLAPEPGSPCDAPGASIRRLPDGTIECRCVVCSVTATTREFHFCCPQEPGCELEAKENHHA